MTSDWTEERVGQLVSGLNKGLTGSQIAVIVGKTRNAVIGFIQRHHLRAAPSDSWKIQEHARKRLTDEKRQQRQQRAKERRMAREHVKRAAQAVLPQAEPVGFVPKPDGVLLKALEASQCHFPVGSDPEAIFAPTLFCGADCVDGKPYCEKHASQAYQKPKPRKVTRASVDYSQRRRRH